MNKVVFVVVTKDEKKYRVQASIPGVQVKYTPENCLWFDDLVQQLRDGVPGTEEFASVSLEGETGALPMPYEFCDKCGAETYLPENAGSMKQRWCLNRHRHPLQANFG